MPQPWKRRWGAVAALMIVLSLLLAPAASASSSASGCQPVYYTVRVGDTLTRIAARYGVSIQSIMAANGIWNENVIYAGQTLAIPGTCPPPPPPGPRPGPGGACFARYTVAAGDSLTRIAWRFGTSVANLQRCNGIANPNRIYAGQPLCICGGAWQPTPPKPVPPTPPKVGPWRAQYFNSKDLSGPVVVARNETKLDYAWGYGSPAAQVFADGFSARWQQTLNIATGTYRVTVTADDGVRISIDNVLVIDAWKVQPATTYTQDVIIMGGSHLITVEYFENDQVAEIHFSMPKIAN